MREENVQIAASSREVGNQHGVLSEIENGVARVENITGLGCCCQLDIAVMFIHANIVEGDILIHLLRRKALKQLTISNTGHDK